MLHVSRDNFNFEHLYLTKDSEYGTHVAFSEYYCFGQPYRSLWVILSYYSEYDDFNKLIDEINDEINKEFKIQKDNL